MKIVHILTGVVLEVTKEQATQYTTKVVGNPANDSRFKVGQVVKVGKAAIGRTYEIVE